MNAVVSSVPAAVESTWPKYERRVALGEVMDALVAEGLIEREAADKLRVEARLRKAGEHPLAVVAAQNWKSLKTGKVLSLEVLSEWLAAKAGLDYFHVDPLKIDFTRVGELMSITYATRFSILPVERSNREVTIATSEPFLTEWVKELEQILRIEIRRVVANPVDLTRYITEFFTLARSIKGASKDKDGVFDAGVNNFEQLVELGKTGRAIDANEQHVVRVVDWLFQYAYAQRASDIHLEPRREQGVVRFRIDGVLQQVYQVPSAVFAAITSRIKILGRMDVAENLDA